MIKIKIVNPFKGRNEPTFRPFVLAQELFHQAGIVFTEGSDYDLVFVGMADFINRKVSLQESTEQGIEFIKEYGDKCFLFDGSDSTSLLGGYEVLVGSNARFLFKNQLLKERTSYKHSTPFNKWFFKGDCELSSGYDIPENTWNKIKLSGYNLGSLLPHYHTHYIPSENKVYDICAIYQAYHPENYNHKVRDDIFYTEHRSRAWDELSRLQGMSILKDKLPKEEYLEKMYKSKVALSPFGMGEICFRDFELMQFGTVMLKPSMEHIQTIPNPYIKSKTYVPVKDDWTDLCNIALQVVDDYKTYQQLASNFREEFKNQYTLENFVEYWTNLLRDQPEGRVKSYITLT